MSKKLITQMFDLIDEQNFDALRSVFDADIVYERPGYAPIHGIDAIVDFYKNVRMIASGEHLLEHIAADVDCCASWGKFVGKDRKGNDLSARFADCYTYRKGKVHTRTTFFYEPGV